MMKPPDVSWMTCVTCRKLVISNPTGICLACQGGFTNEICEDSFLHYLKECENAVKKRLGFEDR